MSSPGSAARVKRPQSGSSSGVAGAALSTASSTFTRSGAAAGVQAASAANSERARLTRAPAPP
jgi:hypothetical protein